MVRSSVVSKLEAAEELDRVSERLRPAVAELVGTGRRRDLLTGRWLGHAFHPAAVLAPLGCWIGAAVADTVGGHSAERAARRLIGAGVVAAGPAIASGSADWLDTRHAEQRVGIAHAMLNDFAFTAMGVSWVLRGRGHRGAGIVASSIGLGGVLAAGMLGGHLAYARGVGVSTTAFQAGPDEWTPLIDVDEVVDGEPTAVEHDGIGYVVVSVDGEVRVLENRCTHRGGPLAGGSVVDGCIECPWHGSRFALVDGHVASGPASIDQPAYETRTTNGRIEIRRTELGGLRHHAA